MNEITVPALSLSYLSVMVVVYLRHGFNLSFGGTDSRSNSKSHLGHSSSPKSLTSTLKNEAKYTDSHEISLQARVHDGNI